VTILSAPNPQVTLTAKVTDNGDPPLTLTQGFSLPVTEVDLSELALPPITISNSRVSEDSKEGTVVGDLYNANNTLSDNVIFTITKDAQNLFKVRDDNHSPTCQIRVEFRLVKR
jgi:hypothetical protein